MIVSANKVREGWQLLVEQSPYATFFQTEKAYDFYRSQSYLDTFALAVVENNQVTGVAVGYIQSEKGIKSYFSKRAIIMGGLLLDTGISNEALSELLQAIKMRTSKAIYVEIRNHHDYSAFAVSTIDRFFQQTLKAFSREIGQFASYQVELDKNSLVAESVDRILDSLTEEDSGLLSWLTDNVLEQIEQGGRYSMDANLLEMAKRLKSSQRQEALESAGIDSEEDYSKERLLEIRKRCREIISLFRNEVKVRADKALAILHEAGVNPVESRNKFMNELYVYSELADNERVPRPKDTFFKNAADSDLWFAKTKAKALLPLVYPFLEAPLEDFCSLFGKEFDVYNTACILDGQLYGLGVAGELSRTFNELMKEKNVLCIDDSNTILRDIIDGSDAPFVYEKIGVRYDHYLLDEFQDRARVQWQNF